MRPKAIVAGARRAQERHTRADRSRNRRNTGRRERGAGRVGAALQGDSGQGNALQTPGRDPPLLGAASTCQPSMPLEAHIPLPSDSLTADFHDTLTVGTHGRFCYPERESMEKLQTAPAPHAALSISYLPPLEAGDHLAQATFHARYEAMPPDFRAELIGGVVFVPSPIRLEHGE